MPAGKSLRWRTIAVLAVFCAVVLGVSLAAASFSTDSAPAKGPYRALVLKGKLTRKVAWKKVLVNVTWNGRKAGDIPSDLKAVYRGESLFKLIGLVDDTNPRKFNVALAKRGYTIRLVAKDGYTWDLKSKNIIGKKKWIVARLKNGKALPGAEGPYRFVGPFIHHFYGRQSVKLLVRIELIF